MTIVIPAASGDCTLASIRQAVYNRGYASDVASALTGIINDVYDEVASDHAWDWLEAQSTGITTTIGDPSYALSAITDLVTLQQVRIQQGTDFFDLEYQDPVALATDLHIDRANGIPRRWTRRSSELLLYPRPERAYTLVIDYIRDPAELVADTDSPIFPATFCPILVYGALAELSARTRDWAQHDRHRARFDKLLSRMRTRAGVQQQQSSLQVRQSGFFNTDAPAPYGWRP